MPQNQKGNMGKDDEEPMKEVASADPYWNVGKTPQQGPTQSWLMALTASTDKSLNSFDELMSTPIDFSAYIMNGLKITNLTQETLLGPTFRLFKGTRTNYAELEYDFEECYKDKAEKLVFGKSQKAYDLPGIEDMVPNIWSSTNSGRGNEETWVRRSDNDLYTFKEGNFPRLRVNDIEDMMLLVVQNRLTNLLGDDVYDFTNSMINVYLNQKLPDPASEKETQTLHIQGFMYVEKQGRNRLMRSDELYKFSDGTLTRLRTSLEDITKNIHMEYLPKRRWISLEKKRAHIMIKAINKLHKERRVMRSLEKFISGRHYGTDLRLLQQTI
ncbi:hypothetical protein Tco_0945759 [Tanacetum coccineum]